MDTVTIGLSNPWTLIGLLLGATCPFFIDTIRNTIARWLLFVVVLKRRPNFFETVFGAYIGDGALVVVTASTSRLDTVEFGVIAAYLGEKFLEVRERKIAKDGAWTFRNVAL